MGRKELPQALTLERFAAGKDGRANAFKKKKQANKRKLFEKAQLKRQYAKLLKKEAAGEHGSPALAETERFESKSQKGREGELAPSPLSNRRRKGWRGRRLNDVDKQEDGEREQHTEEAKDTSEKRRRPEHRPDPFKEAKVKADRRRQEAEEQQRQRARQKAEKEDRAKKRRKQHHLLSKRTRGGQPVMKHTMQHLLEKIQSTS